MAAAQAPAQAADPGRSVTSRALAVVGGGEHAVVVVEAARSRPDTWRVVGFSDRDRPSRLGMREPDLEDFGDDAALRKRLEAAPDTAPALILGFGGGARPDVRAAASARFDEVADWATVVHAWAWVSPSAKLGPGTFVGAGAVVQAGAVVGRHVIVNSGALVEHDVIVGDFCHIAPGAAIGGGTILGAGVFVGLGARVRDHLRVGERATIGMGAVVVGDVAAGRTVIGVPARGADS